MKWSSLITALLFVATALPVSAYWKEEVVPLKAGWNAVQMHVDTSDRLLDDWVGKDTSNPIEEIWLWVPPRAGMSEVESPSSPSLGSTEWRRWDRNLAGSSPLRFLPGNVAVLVRVSSNVPEYNWVVKGKVLPPDLSWSSAGLNFLGFPVPAVNPPLWSDFLGPSRALHNFAEIYRYVGGNFSASNPQRLFPTLLRGTRMVRNHAYWVRSEEYNRYFGPIEIDLQNPTGIRFGATLSQYLIRVRNATSNQITVTAALIASATPPTNQSPVAGQVPLIVRGERDLTDLTYAYLRFGVDQTSWSLAPAGQPGSSIDMVIGLDRSLMTNGVGAQYAGILRLTDNGGMIQLDLPVSAEVASTAGLWIGNAFVGEVQHYLAQYNMGPGGIPNQNEDGSYMVEGVDTKLTEVSRPFPLRLLIHQGASGNAKLMQRVFYGAAPGSNAVLAREERFLDPAQLSSARRMSATHLPWSTNNVMWSFDGALVKGGEITAEVVIPYDNEISNPFVHTYHPDHDNLDARFENSLPRGVESFDVVRRITLELRDPERETFDDIVGSSGILTGIYNEELILRGRGSAERTIRTRGAFAINHITEIDQIKE